MRARRWGRAGLVGLAAAAALPAGAGAVPTPAGEYPVGGNPGRLTVGLDGSAWASVPALTQDTVRVTAAGVVTGFDLPAIGNAQGASGLATAADGRIWAVTAGKVVSFDPSDPVGTQQELSIPAIVTSNDLTFGPGGRLYLVAQDGGGVARMFIIDTTTLPGTLVNAGGTPIAGLQNPKGITAGGDGRLYVGDSNGNQLIAFDPALLTSTAIAVPGAVQGVAAGPGTQLGFTQPQENGLGRLTPGGAPEVTPVALSDSFGITFGRDGAYWAPGFLSGTAIRMTTDGQVSSPITFAAPAHPRYVAAGANNTVWFSLEGELGNDADGRLAQITGVEPPPPPPPPPPPVDPGGGGAPPPGGGGTPPVDPPVVPARPGLTGVLAPRALTAGRVLILRARVTSTQRVRLAAAVARRLPGRRAASGRCVAPRPALARRRACVRFIPVAGIARGASVTGTAGRVVIRTGPGRGRLKPGTYRIRLVAISATGLRSPLRTRIVTVRRA